MVWTVLGEDKGKVALVSKKDSDGILHKGSYLTIEDDKTKFILRVDDTSQLTTYTPHPLIIDMDLSPIHQDQNCKNLIYAERIVEYPERDDGKSNFIKPQMIARISTQEEINRAFGEIEGIPVFPATVFARSVQRLRDDHGKFVSVKIPEDFFFHQTLITGRTGSGKTVGMKYLAQYFLEDLKTNEIPGAVLAVNVKEEDMLTMDKNSVTKEKEILKEWKDLKIEAHGVESFRVYYPGIVPPNYSEGVDFSKCEKITLSTKNLDPETLTGLLQNITDIAAEQLPLIFRFWKEKRMKSGDTLEDFVKYFSDPLKEMTFDLMNSRGEELPPVRLHYGTYNSLKNSLINNSEYFDVEGAKELNAGDILQPGKMSVIDVTSKKGFGFGAVLLRDLLDKIYSAKSDKVSEVPILIIIDEIHEFYGSARSREALQTLDAICRKGRSLQIGVIFASQNPEDMPKGISSVVNSKIHFKSELARMKSLGVSMKGFDPEALKPGYCVASIHGLSQLKFMKFPMALSGVGDGKDENG